MARPASLNLRTLGDRPLKSGTSRQEHDEEPASDNVERHTEAGPPHLNTPPHPTQLYESIAEFAIFGILYWRIGKPHERGAIISLYLMLYSAARFAVEFFRYHEQGNLLGGPLGGPLDTSQWISLALFAIGAAYFVAARRHRTAPQPA